MRARGTPRGAAQRSGQPASGWPQTQRSAEPDPWPPVGFIRKGVPERRQELLPRGRGRAQIPGTTARIAMSKSAQHPGPSRRAPRRRIAQSRQLPRPTAPNRARTSTARHKKRSGTRSSRRGLATSDRLFRTVGKPVCSFSCPPNDPGLQLRAQPLRPFVPSRKSLPRSRLAGATRPGGAAGRDPRARLLQG